ncbi:MAG: EF-hand domain-containing protein [Phycisphaerae bacterium]|jgi:Ca2+-binding EF-hand superfamily protein
MKGTLGFRWFAGILATGWFVSGTWAADEPRPLPEDRQARLLKKYPAMDADKDGKVTREEMRKYLSEQHAANRKDLAKPETTEEGPRRLNAGAAARRPGAGPAGLYPDPARLLRMHPEADTDKNGQLSPEEMRAFIREHGAELRAEILKRRPELDANKDGVLSEDELRAAREKEGGLRARLVEMVLKRFPESDANKDGRLTPEELRAFMQANGDKVRAEVLKRHPRLDRDGDGVLSQEEFAAAMRAAAAAGGPGERVNRAQREKRILKSFPEADTDKDGRLSDEEFAAWRKQHPEAGPPAGTKPEEKSAKPARPAKTRKKNNPDQP